MRQPVGGRLLRVWFGAFLLWTAIAGVFATQLYFAGLSWQQALAWTLPRWYAWGLVTPGIFWMDRRLAATTSFTTRVVLHVPSAVIWTSVTIVLRLVTRGIRGAVIPQDFSRFFLDRFYSDLPIYAVLAGISFARLYADQVKRSTQQAHELALRTTDLERRLVEAQLQSLRAQLQPHFLFNALNTISAFTESSPVTARRLMAQLGDLLRASLRHAAQPLVTLSEELTFLDDFLAIESARFEERLRWRIEVEPAARDLLLPPMLLQMLVENAVKHGIGHSASGGEVSVSARCSDGVLALRVTNPGRLGRAGGTRIGLANAQERLRLLYGARASLRLAAEHDVVTAAVTLPAEPRT